jgi:asparagine synthase (glutamine-hydrolysing)
MCGIAGILDFKQIPVDPAAIRRMTDAMAHRGPDATGFFSEGPVTLGHLRLSIIDLSSAANQPFTDASGRYVIVFNGEMYNYNEVKPLLAGYPFETTGDTEALIAAYAKWGPDCLGYFRGMFAFAIWDKQEKELFIARDRMGVKPFYYSFNEERLVFASEVRGILASGLVKRQINEKALADYFSYQSIGYPYSLIEGIEQLEAGSWAKIKEGRIEKKVYWDVTTFSTARATTFPSAPGFDPGDRLKVQGRIRELLLQSIERRLVSDVPVGAFLSGGIDSSAIVGLMAAAGNTRPNTFTISFTEKEYDESHYADLIAKKFNTHHTSVLLKPTVFLDELTAGLDAMDTPSGDGINTYVVSKAIAHKGMRVALSGVGGDELFAGYSYFGFYPKLQGVKWIWSLPGTLRSLVADSLFSGPGSGRKERIRQILKAPSCAIEEVYPILRQVLTPKTINRILAAPGSLSATALRQDLESKAANLEKLPLLSQVSAAEYLGYTQHTLLKDTDQMSMASSLEVREPFFDQDLVEFVLSVPDSIKRPQYPKSLLVESLKPLLPDEIVFRKKQGFVFPWNEWIKNELRDFCGTHIRKMAERPFIKGDALLRLWEDFLRGDKDIRWMEIWLFVVLEYWLEKNDVG